MTCFPFCTSIDVEIESKQHTESITEIFYFICVNIFCCERFCKRLKWPKGSEKGSPTELGQYYPLDRSFPLCTCWTDELNQSKQLKKDEVCFLFQIFIPHTCQILSFSICYLEVKPKNAKQNFSSVDICIVSSAF